ncbi:uncharacterized protein LOC125121428 isoform X1 [Phacochoerus africanus]|uniref:uncharacterized protein LOC125121428 isoform X1 n=1 Tax=Phacochoerus africanus TaxID=41426 RepID=UPI001FD8F43A|nr:uncharacterized protein LOC125121428 isoform X1 [Phacochoerus africanus]
MRGKALAGLLGLLVVLVASAEEMGLRDFNATQFSGLWYEIALASNLEPQTAPQLKKMGAVLVEREGPYLTLTSVSDHINRCVKETTQAVKGDAPGKFKFPKEPGKERGAQQRAPHPQPRSALRSRWGPAAALSMRAGWRGDTLSGGGWLSLRRWALRLPGVNPASPVGAWPQQGASWAPRARCLRVRLCAKATGGPAAATPSSPPLASGTTMSEGFVTCSLKSLAGRMRVFLSWLVGVPVQRARVNFTRRGAPPARGRPLPRAWESCVGFVPQETKTSPWWPRTTGPTPS